MAAQLFNYVDANGGNPITAWLAGLQKKQLAKVNLKLKALEQNGDEVLPNFVTPAVGSRQVKEIVIGGDVALRLLICKGPINTGIRPADANGHRPSPMAAPEFTLLFGAEERDGQYVPRDAVQQAEERREIILRDHRRRVRHVYVGPPNA